MNESGEMNKEAIMKATEDYFKDHPEFLQVAKESVDKAFEDGWLHEVFVLQNILSQFSSFQAQKW